MDLNVQVFLDWLRGFGARLMHLESLLNDLDNRIGDGDHGTNMKRGFHAAVNKLESTTPHHVAEAAQVVAMTLLGTVGGASGPLYSTAFLRFASAWKDLDSVDFRHLVDGLASALEGIQARGKAKVGEKTMVDVWHPFVSTLRSTNDLSRSVIAAHEAALASRELVATKGRAAYLGERSRGTCDPGSVSSAVLFTELAAALGQEVSLSTWLTQVS